MTFNPDYHPRNHAEKLNLIKEVDGYIDDIKNIDVDSAVDSAVDSDVEQRGFINGLQRDISKPADSASGVIDGLKSEILSDLEQDFTEKLGLYKFLVEKEIEEDTFPLNYWAKYVEKIEQEFKVSIGISYKDIFDTISDLSKVNKSLAKENLANYLIIVKDHINSPNDFFPAFESFMKKTYPDIDLLNILSAKDGYEVIQSLKGEHISLKENSALFFMYAASVPNSSWAFKEVENAPQKPSPCHKPQLKISTSTSNFDEIFEEFAKTDIWKRIDGNSEFKKKFIEQAYNQNLKYPLFWETEPNSKAPRPIKQFNWDNIKACVKHLVKDDVELAESIVSFVFSKLTKDKHEQHTVQAMQAVNIALHGKLQKEMPVVGVKEKKNKI